MKCPKCGSEVNKHYLNSVRYVFTCKNKNCVKYEKEFTPNQIDKMRIKQRLDKVLVKLKIIRLPFPRGISIQWKDNGKYVQFRLYGNSNFEDDSITLSLNTIEHIIADIENQ